MNIGSEHKKKIKQYKRLVQVLQVLVNIIIDHLYACKNELVTHIISIEVFNIHGTFD